MGELNLLAHEWKTIQANYFRNLENRPYYDDETDNEMKKDYYSRIAFDHYLKRNLTMLLQETHSNELGYTPHRFLYPWVDLQENGELKSLYSGKGMNPLSVIEEDLILHENREKGRISVFSGGNLLNCEHVVPQSWFLKKEPMRGDLHHLFACEPSCNSSRSNYPYDDFQDYVPEARISGVKDGCGKSDSGKFEPEYGKGIVARATLYFLTRYPNTIQQELTNLPLLLEWHNRFPVSRYEMHRNQAIQELQGNRNPFIDYPELVEQILK